MELPAGLTHRPLRLDDAASVVEVMAAFELAVVGTVVIDLADILSDWNRPSFDIETNTVGVFDGERLLGYAEISGAGRADAAVHPDHVGRGIGTALARWMQDTARAHGQAEVGMAVPEGSPGEVLLRSLGYTERWRSWVLGFPEGAALAAQPLPPGYSLRIAEDDDLEAAWNVIEDAFLEWSVREKQTQPDWISQVVGRPGYEPWNLQVVTDPEDHVVGGVHVTIDGDGLTGFVDKVAVRADQRGRGLARALLAAAFASAREHGAHRSELSTDSRTGALDLYLGLGMEISSNWVNLAVKL